MKKVMFGNEKNTEEIASMLGINLLHATVPVVIADGGDAADALRTRVEAAEPFEVMTDDKSAAVECRYAEISANECTVIFDIREALRIDRVYIGNVLDNNGETCVRELTLYIADDLQLLFNRENEVIRYNDSVTTDNGETAARNDRIFDLEGFFGRYFAIKISKLTSNDNTLKIGAFGIYNRDYNEKHSFYNDNFGKNLISGITPTAKGSYSADLSLLTDGICFDEKHRTVLSSETEYIFKLDEAVRLGGISVVGSDEAVKGCVVFLADNKDDVFADENLAEVELVHKPTSRNGTSAALLKLHGEAALYIGLRFPKECVIDQLGAEKFIEA